MRYWLKNCNGQGGGGKITPGRSFCCRYGTTWNLLECFGDFSCRPIWLGYNPAKNFFTYPSPDSRYGCWNQEVRWKISGKKAMNVKAITQLLLHVWTKLQQLSPHLGGREPDGAIADIVRRNRKLEIQDGCRKTGYSGILVSIQGNNWIQTDISMSSMYINSSVLLSTMCTNPGSGTCTIWCQ